MYMLAGLYTILHRTERSYIFQVELHLPSRIKKEVNDNENVGKSQKNHERKTKKWEVVSICHTKFISVETQLLLMNCFVCATS